MGTAKRERQKANKALRQNELDRAEQRKKGTRIAVIVIGAVVAVFALVWIANIANTADRTKDRYRGRLSSGDTSVPLRRIYITARP